MNSGKIPTQLLTEGATILGVNLSVKENTQLITYIEELLRWSPRIDLISQTDPVEIIRKHILDSLAVAPYIQEGAVILDLGSGAGLPGVPLAILLAKSSITLLEARRKRVSFLKTIARNLKLENLSIYEGRAEIFAQEPCLQEIFDVVITRATWNTKQFLHFATPFVRRRGMAMIMKGPGSSKDQNNEGSEEYSGFLLKEQRDYSLPFGQEKRRLLIFAKSSA